MNDDQQEKPVPRSTAYYRRKKSDPEYMRKRREYNQRYREEHFEWWAEIRAPEKRSEEYRRYVEANSVKERMRGRAKSEKRRAPLQAVIDKAKEVGCVLCGEREYACLDLHHIDPDSKSFNVGVIIVKAIDVDALQDEVEKCICLCANCHRKFHAGLVGLPHWVPEEFRWWDLTRPRFTRKKRPVSAGRSPTTHGSSASTRAAPARHGPDTPATAAP